MAFPLAFRIIAVVGGLYVAWLGAKALWAVWRDKVAPFDTGRGADLSSAFRDGFAVQLSNPKAIIFFTAVLPPFVDPARPAVPQLALLGATMIVMDSIAMSGYGLAGGALASALRQDQARRAFSALVGVLLLMAAALILLRDELRGAAHASLLGKKLMHQGRTRIGSIGRRLLAEARVLTK